MERENLYFMALIPNEQICNEIDAFKRDLARRFESTQALKVVPHITLKMPFKLPSSRHFDLLQWLRCLSLDITQFNIELKNFGAFPNRDHPVIYVNPITTIPLLSLQHDLIRRFWISFPKSVSLNRELKFTPHITVAYRDLRPEKFVEAWKIYDTEKYAAIFDVNNFHLLQHNTKKWNICDTYNF
ncbi:2'-5' RNA ligase family protein [Flavitalea sp.]|nr:2'-5' RNA ligase family protein [Flavitalea sp.]